MYTQECRLCHNNEDTETELEDDTIIDTEKLNNKSKIYITNNIA